MWSFLTDLMSFRLGYKMIVFNTAKLIIFFWENIYIINVDNKNIIFKINLYFFAPMQYDL